MALQPKYLPGNTESWHLDQICPVFIAPVSTRSLRWPTPPCTRPLTGLCGDSEVEGNGTGGWGVAATYPQTDCFNLGARKNTCAPRRCVCRGGLRHLLCLNADLMVFLVLSPLWHKVPPRASAGVARQFWGSPRRCFARGGSNRDTRLHLVYLVPAK